MVKTVFRDYAIAFLAVLLLSVNGWGCAAAGDAGPTVLEPLVLSPDPDLADATQEAADAWAVAAGLEIVLGTGGVHVRRVADAEDCGSTYTMRRGKSGRLVRVDAIEIRGLAGNDCRSDAGTMRHELGHALQHWSSPNGFPPDKDGHSEGLMAPKANNMSLVDEAALELVCATAPCAAFAPETHSMQTP